MGEWGGTVSPGQSSEGPQRISSRSLIGHLGWEMEDMLVLPREDQSLGGKEGPRDVTSSPAVEHPVLQQDPCGQGTRRGH